MSERYHAAIAAGEAALKRKDFETAKTEFETALDVRPSFVPLLARYAEACLKAGDKEAAFAAFKKLLLLEPGNRIAASHYARLSLSLGVGDEEGLVRRAREMSRNDPKGGLVKRLIGKVTGQGTGGEPIPDEPGMSSDQARQFHDAKGKARRGNADEAAPPLERLLAELPDDPRVLELLVRVNFGRRYWEDAHHYASRLREIDPERTSARLLYIRACIRSERHGEARALFAELSEDEKTETDAQMCQAMLYEAEERSDDAIEVLNKLEEAHPGQPDVAALRARILSGSGRFEEARPALAQWVDRAPLSAAPFAAAAVAKVMELDSDIFSKAMALADNPEVSQTARATVNFALMRAHKHAGKEEAAFQFMLKGNASIDHFYDTVAEDRFMEAIQEVFTPELVGRASPSGRGDGLVFVCGLPRSGSTLTAQILGSHPDAISIGESQAFPRCVGKALEYGYPEKSAEFGEDKLEELGEMYLASLPEKARDAKFVIDKELQKYPHLGLLQLVLPGARIVNTVRHPMDVGYSNLCHNFQGWPAMYRQETMGHFMAWHDKMMAHWTEVLPQAPHVLRYEDLIADTEGVARRLLDAVGMPFHEDCLNFQQSSASIKTASVHQVRQKIHSGSVAAWKRHEDGLTALRQSLEAHGVEVTD